MSNSYQLRGGAQKLVSRSVRIDTVHDLCQITGTVSYMSPEQVQAREVDARSDLFALGIILYEMFAGQHPWRRPSPVETLHAILHDEVPTAVLASSAGAELSSVVQKLLCKNPADRYESAEKVLEPLFSRSRGLGFSSADDHC